MQADGHGVENLVESIWPKVTAKSPTNEGAARQIAQITEVFCITVENNPMHRRDGLEIA